MDLGAIERSVRASGAAAIVADPRLVRRVIKAHRRLPGLGLAVPHARCYALSRAELCAAIDPAELGLAESELPPQVILLARPGASELAGRTPAEVLTRLWRAAFHAEVHLSVERRVASGALDAPRIRARIDSVGQAEFDEIRAILRSDDRLLPPADDRETFVELTALWLELRQFAPALLRSTFPGLVEAGRVDAMLDAEVDAGDLLERSCPAGADRSRTVVRVSTSATTSPTFSSPATFTIGEMFAPRRPSAKDVPDLVSAADRAARRGNAVRAALLRVAAASGAGPEAGARWRSESRADLDALGARLDAALRPLDATDTERGAGWGPSLFVLAEQAAARPGLRYPIEARLLYDLQRAAVAHEKGLRSVDLVTWALSWGKVPVVRPLPATRELRVARELREAAAKVRYARVPAAERKLLAKLLRWASERADRNVRAALRPRLEKTLTAVGLRPENVPERVGRDKLVEELLDRAVRTGHASLAHLRDALSRNQLKLDDLGSARELAGEDALLEADRRLSRALDGVYRRGELYLRALQKLSSVAFGTRPGRLFTLYAALPLGGAFVLLVATSHLASSISHALGRRGEVDLLGLVSFLATTVAFLPHLHSELARAAAWRAVSALGAILSALLLRAPRWFFTRPSVRRVLERPTVRAVIGRVLVPFVLGLAAWALGPRGADALSLAVAASVFAATSALMSSRVAVFVENAFFDWLAPTWRQLSERALPGLLRLVIGVFRVLMDLLERAIYQVDEWLRFRDGESRRGLAPKAVVGLAWFFVAYAIRFYVTLMVEPELNPVKHFPVVTVAHKLLLPFAGELLDAFERVFSPLGRFVGGALAATTAFLLPSASGFLAWELKENWKLYRHNRPLVLCPSVLGSHGETMSAMLVPGFHSGTIPKLFQHRRRAAQREDASSRDGDTGRAHATEGALGSFREGIEEAELAVRRFVEREMLGLLRRSRRWTRGPLAVTRVELAPNRVRVEIAGDALGALPCALLFEEQSGLLVASVAEAGFVAALADASDERTLFENALAGFYHLAGVDLVRESIEAALGGDVPYDVADEGLVVWPGGGYRTEAVYPLATKGGRPLVPSVRGEPLPSPPPPLEAKRILYGEEPVAWSAWVAAWGAADRREGAIPRLVRGPSLLPPPDAAHD